MNRSMISAAVSMNALQQKLDLIAGNMANMNTIGYKKREVSFQDVLTQTISQHPDMILAGRQTAPGLTVGGGVRLSGLRLDLSQGSLFPVEDPLSLAIEGPALFEVEVPIAGMNGEETQPLWTRSGQFSLAYHEGEGAFILTSADGYPVFSAEDEYISIPEYVDFEIDDRGIVTYTNEDGESEIAGQIKLMRVDRPELMVAVGSNLYGLAEGVQDQDNVLQTVDFALPENEGIAIRQYFTEQSNVDFTEEMSELIMVQRAYQLNARAITSGDTMMSLANQLRR